MWAMNLNKVELNEFKLIILSLCILRHHGALQMVRLFINIYIFNKCRNVCCRDRDSNSPGGGSWSVRRLFFTWSGHPLPASISVSL